MTNPWLLLMPKKSKTCWFVTWWLYLAAEKVVVFEEFKDATNFSWLWCIIMYIASLVSILSQSSINQLQWE